MMRIGRFEYDISNESLPIVRTGEQAWTLQTPSETALTVEVSSLRDELKKVTEEQEEARIDTWEKVGEVIEKAMRDRCFSLGMKTEFLKVFEKAKGWFRRGDERRKFRGS